MTELDRIYKFVGPNGLSFQLEITQSFNLARDFAKLVNILVTKGCLMVDSEYNKKSSGRTKKSKTKKVGRKV